MRFLFINDFVRLDNKIGMIVNVDFANCFPCIWTLLTPYPGYGRNENDKVSWFSSENGSPGKASFLLVKDYRAGQDRNKLFSAFSKMKCSVKKTGSKRTVPFQSEQYVLKVADIAMEYSEGVRVAGEIRRYEEKNNLPLRMQIIAIGHTEINNEEYKAGEKYVTIRNYKGYESSCLIRLLNDLNLL